MPLIIRNFNVILIFVWDLLTLELLSDFPTAVQTTLFPAVLTLDHVPRTVPPSKIRKKEKHLICLRQMCMPLLRS